MLMALASLSEIWQSGYAVSTGFQDLRTSEVGMVLSSFKYAVSVAAVPPMLSPLPE